MEKELIKAALSMGYRQLKNGVMAKPFGFMVFILKQTEYHGIELESWFASSNSGSTILLERNKFDDAGDYLTWIKTVEASTDVDSYNSSKFEFMTLAELTKKTQEV